MVDEKLEQWIKKNIEGAEGKKIEFGPCGKPAPRRTDAHKAPHLKKRNVLRVIPLGGLDEVGKNMKVFEYGGDILILDMGLQFPEADMLGVDYVIPDISYLQNKLNRIRGIFITHGHLDHIGAIPYILPKLNFPPIYGLPLTIGFIRKRLEEFGLERKAKLHTVDPAKPLRLGQFHLDMFRVNHSIPDGVGLIIRTPIGNVVHTGDFKFDSTPVFQHPADYAKISSLGSQNITALFSDSTNALEPGSTMSEKKIGETLEEIIKNAPGRILIAAFASLVSRIQQVIVHAIKYERKVFLSGRSMIDNVMIGKQLGYIKYPPNTVFPIKKIEKTSDKQALILTTGSQGEAYSALTRMALGDHAQISIKKGDTVVLSSSPIPGNERSVYATINNLVRLGAKVIFNQVMDVHASGHGNQEDLKLMINLVKPKYLIPVHGELFMRNAHGELGRSVGMPEKNIIIVENGDVLEIEKGEVRKSREKVPAHYVMIDGKGIGDVGAQIIMDRQIMAENGVLIVLFNIDPRTKKLLQSPDVITRGFVYMKVSQEIINDLIALAKKSYETCISKNPGAKRGEVKAYIRGELDRYSHRKIERNPLILPIFVGFN